MKRAVILMMLLFLSARVCPANECLKMEKKLWKLQNQIVEQSFRNLPAGAWARYASGLTLVYLGLQVSPKTGKRLYVVEFSGGGPVGQIWYKLTPKDFFYQGRTFRYWTLEPMELYVVMQGGVFYVPKAMIETYMRMTGGNSWSRILKEGFLLPMPNCTNVLDIKESSYAFSNGKRIKAVYIRSRENEGGLYCSPEVPFGMVEVQGARGGLDKLLDFGFKGGRPTLSQDQISQAQPLPMPAWPGSSFPVPFNMR